MHRALGSHPHHKKTKRPPTNTKHILYGGEGYHKPPFLVKKQLCYTTTSFIKNQPWEQLFYSTRWAGTSYFSGIFSTLIFRCLQYCLAALVIWPQFAGVGTTWPGLSLAAASSMFCRAGAASAMPRGLAVP